MNVSSGTLAYPINHYAYRRAIPIKHSPMFARASPLAVSNKIRAIQTRKSRITLQSYYEITDIRPLNITQQVRASNSTVTFSNLSPEKLVERSKKLRLARIAAPAPVRPSVLSSTSTANQQSLIWPSYNSPTALGQESQVNSLPANKSSAVHIPDIHRRNSRAQPATARQPLTERQNILIPIESRHKPLSKAKASIPKAFDRSISKAKSPAISLNLPALPMLHNDHLKQVKNNGIQLYESEEEQENAPLVIDEEFEEYLRKAMVKCADWLIKYVFDRTYDELHE